MDCVKCSYTYTKLLTEMKDDIINYIKFLQKHGVIKTQLRCPKCGQLCRELNNDFVFR